MADDKLKEKRRRQNREAQQRYRERYHTRSIRSLPLFPVGPSPSLLPSTGMLPLIDNGYGDDIVPQCEGDVQDPFTPRATSFSPELPDWKATATCNLEAHSQMADASQMTPPASGYSLLHHNYGQHGSSQDAPLQQSSIASQHQHQHHLTAFIDHFADFSGPTLSMARSPSDQYRHRQGHSRSSPINPRQTGRRRKKCPNPPTQPPAPDLLSTDTALQGTNALLLGMPDANRDSHQPFGQQRPVITTLPTIHSPATDGSSGSLRNSSHKIYREQAPSRAESIISDFERLYEFGVDLGILPKERGLTSSLKRMRGNFRSLSRASGQARGCRETGVSGRSANRLASDSENEEDAGYVESE